MASEEKQDSVEVPIPFALDIDEFNKKLAERIIESSVGAKVRQLIDQRLTTLTSEYDKALRQMVDQLIREVARDMVEERREDIKAKVAERFNEQYLDGVIERGLKKLHGY